MAQVFNHVAQFGRFLEIHFLGDFAHFFFERRDHLARMSLKKFARLYDALAILPGANLTQARRHLISGRF